MPWVNESTLIRPVALLIRSSPTAEAALSASSAHRATSVAGQSMRLHPGVTIHALEPDGSGSASPGFAS
jgi:hypothetical protein